jgi:uncharacterized protein (DUF488 family)
MKLYTIGHSNHSIQAFSELLEKYHVTRLVDVRSAPYSKYVIQFNKESLDYALSMHKIKYSYGGKQLGGRPPDPTCYRSGSLPDGETDYLHEVDYPAVMQRPWFQKGITHLLELAENAVTAVMCSEENPADCHRHHLIAKYLLAEFPEWEIQHIRGDGVLNNATSIHTSVNPPPGEQLSLF